MRRPGRIINMGYPPIRHKGASCVSKVAHEEKAPAEGQRGGHFLVRRVVASIEVVIWRRGEYEWMCDTETIAKRFSL
jgi:hypothetical protein